jgi:hypothetical protein
MPNRSNREELRRRFDIVASDCKFAYEEREANPDQLRLVTARAICTPRNAVMAVPP